MCLNCNKIIDFKYKKRKFCCNDCKDVTNNILNNYKATDFYLYYESNLTGSAKAGKKYNVQVGLYTENYYKTKLRKDTCILVLPEYHRKVFDSSTVIITGKDSLLTKALYVVDGKIMQKGFGVNKINPNDIASINILKDEVAVNKYGDEGKNGVIEISTKKAFRENLPYDYANFLNRNKDVRSLNWSNDNKNVTISLNDGTSETYLLWIPGSKQRAIDKYGVLPTPPPPPPSAKPVVTSVPSEHPLGNKNNDNKVFTEVQVPASFPGGLPAWQNFLGKNLDVKVPVTNGAAPGRYAVNISFVVTDKGELIDIKAENDPGYGMAEEAVRVFKRSPSWKPAVQNGQELSSRHKQSIVFVVSK